MTLRHSPTRSAEGGPGTPELLGPLCAKGLAGLRPPPAFSVSAGGISGGISVLLPLWERRALCYVPQSVSRHGREQLEASLKPVTSSWGLLHGGSTGTKRTPFSVLTRNLGTGSPPGHPSPGTALLPGCWG